MFPCGAVPARRQVSLQAPSQRRPFPARRLNRALTCVGRVGAVSPFTDTCACKEICDS